VPHSHSLRTRHIAWARVSPQGTSAPRLRLRWVGDAESRSREESLEECVAELHEALQLYEQDGQTSGAMKHGAQEDQVRRARRLQNPFGAPKSPHPLISLGT